SRTHRRPDAVPARRPSGYDLLPKHSHFCRGAAIARRLRTAYGLEKNSSSCGPFRSKETIMNRSTAVNVQTFINEHPFSPFQWLIFFMCFVIVLLDGFDTAAIGFIAPSLINEWGIDKPSL